MTEKLDTHTSRDRESPQKGRWRKLPFSDEPMGRQLALSEGMLAALPKTGVPAFRWYVPTEHALVLGNGQKPGMLNEEALSEQGVRAYRRSSGGSVVQVDERLLSMDVALPSFHPLATPDVVDAYRWIGQLWEDALQSLGAAKARTLPTEEQRSAYQPPKDDPIRLACFGTLSPWEVVVGKRKLVGLCQVRRRPGALYQVGIHLRFDPKALGTLLDLGNNQRKTLNTRLHNAVVALDQAAGREVTADEVMTAVEATLSARFGAEIVPAEWLPNELNEADRIQRERFLPMI